MQPIYIVLATGHHRDQMGLLSILGMFENINTKSLPLQIPQLSVFLRFAVRPEEARITQHLAVHIVGEDGNIIAKADGSVSGENQSNRFVFIDQKIPFPNLMFSQFGGYEVNLFMDDELKLSYPFNIIEHKTA